MLKGKKIVIGVCGGIAAYKSANLVRLLVKEGAEVRVIMTPSAHKFITPETLSVLSKNKVLTNFFDHNHQWNSHVDLGLWADLLLIAPATANTLSKMVSGNADNLLIATYLSARCKVMVAPAMDLDMYQHPSTKNNLKNLESFGVEIIPAATGELASGLSGEGRMAEPEQILEIIKSEFAKTGPFAGKKVVISAGPTFEAIDPVRFIGNRSSGKMGIALADEFSKAGAEVTLVLGPTHLRPSATDITLIPVETAEQMNLAVNNYFDSCDIAIMAAAVADYKPEQSERNKIKKKDDHLNLNLIKTTDILAGLGAKKTKQILVGFALETQDAISYAKEKLQKKNLDIVVVNSLEDAGAGFGTDTNKVTIISKDNILREYELKAKELVAKDILIFILDYLKTK